MVRAITAGVAGALAMSVAALLFAEFGIFVGLEQPAGMLLGGEAGAPGTVAAGFGLHLLFGAWLALVYAEGFEAVVGCAGWCVGASFGLVHVLGAGFAVGLLPALATSSASTFAPGLFMAHQGLAGVCCFVLLHVLYGAVVGAALLWIAAALTVWSGAQYAWGSRGAWGKE